MLQYKQPEQENKGHSDGEICGLTLKEKLKLASAQSNLYTCVSASFSPFTTHHIPVH